MYPYDQTFQDSHRAGVDCFGHRLWHPMGRSSYDGQGQGSSDPSHQAHCPSLKLRQAFSRGWLSPGVGAVYNRACAGLACSFFCAPSAACYEQGQLRPSSPVNSALRQNQLATRPTLTDTLRCMRLPHQLKQAVPCVRPMG